MTSRTLPAEGLMLQDRHGGAVRLRPADLVRHGAGILEVFNDAIAHSTALYEYRPRSAADIAEWFDARVAAGFPLLAAEDAAGALLGFASYGTFRAKPAYKYTVEHSVYLAQQARGRGIGRLLLAQLVAEAEAQQVHALVGAVDAGNPASLALHASLGFAEVARMPQVGFKFGRWLDLVFVQRVLATPHTPVDG